MSSKALDLFASPSLTICNLSSEYNVGRRSFRISSRVDQAEMRDGVIILILLRRSKATPDSGDVSLAGYRTSLHVSLTKMLIGP